MRHKQRPIKSSRHKSVTSLNDFPQTSFEHNNTRHMNDVMRLAFLENNDISPETWKDDVDFNSLSTASILKRNIQQHLQQQLKEQQTQLKQQQQQQQQFQQQLLQHQRQLIQQQQLQRHNELSPYDDEDIDDSQANRNFSSFDAQSMGLTDSRIFATTFLPTSSSSSYGSRHQKVTSTPIEAHQLSSRASKVSRQPKTADQTSGGSHDASISMQQVPGSCEAKSLLNQSGQFLCDEPDCGKTFPSLRKLRHHKVVHSDEFPFVCQFKGCCKKFKRKFGIDLHSTTHFDLDQHMYAKTSNNSSLPFFGRRMQYSMCKPCNQKFKTVHEYQFHMLKHGKEPFKCPVKGCGQSFSIWKSFQKHRASHYFNYYCKMDPQCDHSTSNLQLLKLHIYCCHFQRKLPDNATLSSKDPAVEGPTKDDKIDVEDSQEEQSFDVTEQVPPDDELDDDQQTEDFNSYDEQNLELTESRIFATTSSPTTNSSVTSCGQRNSSISNASVVTHQSSNRNSNANRLQRATVQTSNSSQASPKLQRAPIVSETKSILNQSGQFLCDEPDCGKTFPSLRKLRHHKVVHSDEFPFVCQFKGCCKKFKRKFGIDLHSTTHFDLDQHMYAKTSNNSSLPFFGRRMQYSMCKPCNQKFKTVHEYQFHMLKHGKEPFKCPVKGCGQSFSIWKSFQKHRASHYFNYYCKMDPQCDHSTSNLQLLKLHIYCCHFQRKLPDNATLSSKDSSGEASAKDEQVEVEDSREEQSFDASGQVSQEDNEEQVEESVNSQKSTPSTPRRDPRLRRNPPRSSTFGQQDYASMSNGISLAKLTSLSPPVKRQRVFDSQGNTPDKKGSSRITPKVLPKRSLSTSVVSHTTSPKKETKLPLKVLPKRSAQRLPMSLIAADDGTDEDDASSDMGSSNNSSRAGNYAGDGSGGGDKFKCHLCDYSFSVRFQLIKHLSTHLDLSPDMYVATADAKVVQLSERRRREFYCDKCTVKFEKMSDLDVHMRKHGTRPYVCPFCQVPSTFRFAKQYLSHLYEHRFNYRCRMQEGCDFTINRKDALKLHIFRMHMNQQLPAYIENFASMVDCNNEWSEQ